MSLESRVRKFGTSAGTTIGLLSLNYATHLTIVGAGPVAASPADFTSVGIQLLIGMNLSFEILLGGPACRRIPRQHSAKSRRSARSGSTVNAKVKFPSFGVFGGEPVQSPRVFFLVCPRIFGGERADQGEGAHPVVLGSGRGETVELLGPGASTATPRSSKASTSGPCGFSMAAATATWWNFVDQSLPAKISNCVIAFLRSKKGRPRHSPIPMLALEGADTQLGVAAAADHRRTRRGSTLGSIDDRRRRSIKCQEKHWVWAIRGPEAAQK